MGTVLILGLLFFVVLVIIGVWNSIETPKANNNPATKEKNLIEIPKDAPPSEKRRLQDINNRPSIEEFGLSFLEAYCYDESGKVTNFAKLFNLIDENQTSLIKDYLAFKHKFVKDRNYVVGENDAAFRFMEDCNNKIRIRLISEKDKERLKFHKEVQEMVFADYYNTEQMERWRNKYFKLDDERWKLLQLVRQLKAVLEEEKDPEAIKTAKGLIKQYNSDKTKVIGKMKKLKEKRPEWLEYNQIWMS